MEEELPTCKGFYYTGLGFSGLRAWAFWLVVKILLPSRADLLPYLAIGHRLEMPNPKPLTLGPKP